MKKIISILLSVALTLSLTACGGVSQEEHNRLQRELDELRKQINENNNDVNSNNNTASNNQEENEIPYSSLSVGDVIQFGGVDWIVLAVQDGKTLILSDKVLEIREYHSQNGDITWENCDLRGYLNNSFYNSTFNEHEKERITETTVINNDNTEYGTLGGNDTVDNVFLLSIDEVNQYMGDSSHISLRNSRVAEHIVTGKSESWWLRSPGFGNYATANVKLDGFVNTSGSLDPYADNVFGTLGVRPAMWIKTQ
jgi:hypothetical protein